MRIVRSRCPRAEQLEIAERATQAVARAHLVKIEDGMTFRPLFVCTAGLLTPFLALSLSAQQPSTGSSSSKNAKPEQHVKREPASDLAQKIYRDATYGFTYRVPYGWVDRTHEMQGDESDAAKGKVLLAAFERPPEAAGETVNSAVVIAQEPASSYPGLKTAADYVGPVTELATSKGFKSAADPSVLSVDGKELVRCDFTRDLGKVMMRQSTLILVQKQSIVSFTFIGGSEDEVEELVEGLSFGGGRGARTSPNK